MFNFLIFKKLFKYLTFILWKLKIVNCKLVADRHAFTMIEVLIVIALTIGVSVAGFTGFSTFRKSQTLKLGVQELSATLSATRQRAVAQENSFGWGTRLTAGTSTNAHTYQVFYGNSFSTGTTTQSYVLGRGAKFSNPSASSTMDIIFAGATGFPSSSQVISLINGFTDGAVGDVIIKSLGFITTRLDTGLAGYWHLDEGTSTTTYDASGYSKTGTLIFSPVWNSSSNCKVGGCLFFNGINNYVSTPGLPNVGDFTVEGWTYLTDGTTNNNPLYSGGVRLLVRPNAYYFGLTVGVTEYFSQGSTATNLNNWVMWDFVRSGSNMIFYRNGVQFYSSSTIPTTSVNLSGGMGINGSYYMKGYIDEVKIYNRALSATEILNHYNDLK
jgi:Tfp pilus assembly protein FimT